MAAAEERAVGSRFEGPVEKEWAREGLWAVREEPNNWIKSAKDLALKGGGACLRRSTHRLPDSLVKVGHDISNNSANIVGV